MRLKDVQGLDEQTMQVLQQVVQAECDALRGEYSTKIKDLEQYKPKEKSQDELDIEARLKAIEDREQAIAMKEADEQFTTKFEGKGLPKQLAKYFNKQGVEDVETYLDEVSGVFNELQLNNSFKPSEHKSNKDVITKDQFKAMGYSDRVKLMETNRPLYDKLSQQ